jgi:GntR family transcriptional regulator/MocR family aminotransferase
MELMIPIERHSDRPLRDQVYDGLRAAILTGTLAAGVRLPSTRALAADLGLSRFTIADAYGRLMAEGYVAGQVGAGTFVAPSLPAAPRQPPEPVISEDERPQRPWSAWSRRLETIVPAADPLPEAEIDFRHAMPDLDAFPQVIWRRLLARATREITFDTAYYGPAAGLPALREAIAGYVTRSRSLPCTSEQIIITSGSQEAVDLLARVWIDPGDRAVVESPGYPRARRTLALAGAEIVPVPVDSDGLRVDLLTDPAKLAYVTPSHHYPTGGVLPLNRRMALLAWARRHNALILEDDYDSEFRYGHRPIPSLAGLDAAHHGLSSVVYIGTFSKVLFPSLRIGYLVLPADMVERVASAKFSTNRTAPFIEQAVLAEFITEHHFERHLSRVRRRYAERQTALLHAIREELGDLARLDPAATNAGLHLLVSLDTDLPKEEIITRAREAGVHLDDAAACYLAPPERPVFTLGYAYLDAGKMREGLRRLRKVLD